MPPGVLSQKFVHKFDAIHGGFPTVAAVYDRRFSLQHAVKPAVIDRRYSRKNGPEYVSELLTQDTSFAQKVADTGHIPVLTRRGICP